jgi:hypothetical protein
MPEIEQRLQKNSAEGGIRKEALTRRKFLQALALGGLSAAAAGTFGSCSSKESRQPVKNAAEIIQKVSGLQVDPPNQEGDVVSELI